MEAYICEPPPRGKVQRGYLERGAQIPETIKRTTSFTGRDICEWLEKTYPFSKDVWGLYGICKRKAVINVAKIKKEIIVEDRTRER